LASLLCLTIGLGAQSSAEPRDVGPVIQATGAEVEHLTLLIKRQSDGQIWVSNPARAQERYSPASTAKIPHTLIALETGLATPATVYRWDGVIRASRAWNQDQSLASAFRHSAVWVYQEIARMAGSEVLARELARFGYGNGEVGGPDQLTPYWLDDTLKISAAEQIAFLSKLARADLPLSEATYTAARDIMISDQTATWVMRSKTGWRHSAESMDIGWYVGWLDCAEETYVFALNMDMPDTRSLARRKNLTYAVL
jgi:beta-lactamase class D